MSAEMITTIVGVVSLLLAFAGAFGWMIHRMDLLESRLENRLGARIDGVDDKIEGLDRKLSARIDGLDGKIERLDDKLTARIDGLDDKLTARIDGLDEKLSARIDRVADELVEVKIAIARVEGPPRHLLPAR